ncbi:MAG TPA: PLP-dependent aminotransferase family protein [Candidatus Binatia bacterium]|nr:PLP-dependent aminotransferase family protein [Candidatus Binatia bacterium]
MRIPLDRDSAERPPLARQIQEHLERLIRQGLLGPGIKLPATRELARELGVNRTTVSQAYEELVASGWARAHVGQGTFVAERPVERGAVGPVRAPRLDWSGTVSKAAQIASADARRRQAFQIARPGPGVISFAGGMPDSALFPTEAFGQVIGRVIRDEGRELLQYYPASGYPPLREYLAQYLLRFGMEVRPEEILIVNGSQQAFDLVTRTLVDPGDTVAIEDPSYPRAVQVFRAAGAQLLPLPLTSSGDGWGGLSVPALERVLSRQVPKLLYCQPGAHNPTGATMEEPARQRLVELAARHRMPILEDGFDAGPFYLARPPAPLKAMDPAGVVIYVGTFSKILFPGLRLGWVVAAPELIERLETAKELADIHTSPLLQAAVHRFCERHLLERHQARVLREYTERRARLLGALDRLMPPGVTWSIPRGGFCLVVTVPGDASVLLARALARGVAFVPGNAFFVDGGGERMLRLSFSSVTPAEIEEGVRRLAEAVRDLERQPGPAVAPREAAVPLV